MADTGIATRLRAAGLAVREVHGWKTRGRNFAGVAPSFNPKGGVNHHTAGANPTAGVAPSLGTIINGRVSGPDPLPGPLANVYMDFEGTVFVVAAGVANHAGPPDGGVCRGMLGNSHAWGLEIEHPGESPLDDRRVHLATRVWAALLLGKGLPASQVVQHWEWAPSRKKDVATNIHPGEDPTQAGFRRMIAAELRNLTKVTVWTVSSLNKDRQRVEKNVRKPGSWLDNHPGALQRGKVVIRPKRD